MARDHETKAITNTHKMQSCDRDMLTTVRMIRVVRSEISHGKFPEIYSKLSGNLFVNFF